MIGFVVVGLTACGSGSPNGDPDTDTTPPVITIHGDNPVVITQGDTYIDAGATATDDVDGDLTNQITVTGIVDTDTTGEYQLVYHVEDSAGNEATAKRIVRVVTSTADEVNLTSGLVAHYTFDDPDNIGKDSSGNGNDGVAEGGVGTADGVDDYIAIPHSESLNISQDITLSVWVNLHALTGNSDNDIIVNKDGLNQDISYEIGIQDIPQNYSTIPKYNLSFYLGGNGTPEQQSGWTDGGYKFNTDEWVYVVITYDMSNVKIFINGTLIKSYSANASMNTNSGDVRIGARGDKEEVSSFLNGLVDDLRIYNRALNEAEIKKLYEMGLKK